MKPHRNCRQKPQPQKQGYASACHAHSFAPKLHILKAVDVAVVVCASLIPMPRAVTSKATITNLSQPKGSAGTADRKHSFTGIERAQKNHLNSSGFGWHALSWISIFSARARAHYIRTNTQPHMTRAPILISACVKCYRIRITI